MELANIYVESNGLNILDRDSFKNFAENLYDETNGFNEIYITGYFSESIRGSLESIIRVRDRRLA
jgi:hypothetical protein